MIEISDLPQTGSFKIGAFKFYLSDFTYDELCDVLGVPQEIYLIIGYDNAYLYKYEEIGLGKILAFRENDRIVEVHFEPEQDIKIGDIVCALGVKPRIVMNKRLKYLFFYNQFAGRILDEKFGTMNVLGFFDQEYIKKQKLPKFFMSGIAYDPQRLRLIYVD
ncbi:hypothetical protein JW977_00910 [Candidatus Falkowbacteria bacterium]|nr:hypothetical protein [Candidatus Falkowbacteria bacterium]